MSIAQSFKIITISLFTCLLLLPGCTKEDPSILNAALVNGKAITKTELSNEMKRIDKRFNQNSKMSSQQRQQIEKEILEILIGGELLYQASQKLGITIDQSLINEGVSKANEQSTNTFTDTEISKKLYIEKYILNEFSNKTVISDNKAKEYYKKNIDDFTRPEQILVAHILIKTDKNDKPEKIDLTKSKAHEILQLIKNGADFSEMAKEYSQDSSKDNGGLIGYIMRGQMPKNFEKVVFKLEREQISDVVQTEFGFHIIKTIKKKPMKVLAFEDVGTKLKNFLKEQEVQQKIDQFIKSKRKESTIQVFI